ncbi:hypothetical protein DHEL01_v205009 [Diaporthe helianthi]|uniref:Major facilitator superfamily (MFS) profile domain-containing protein n=1 Tax=Diaporthe helianthi TaxID=158607 RepID=A0A2P5I257_DIAHE|nr:hypothetical protein DHEL01_v205009 [Diaporthe helianthi]
MTVSESNSETASKSGAGDVDTEAQVAPITEVDTIDTPTKSEAPDSNIVDWDGPQDPNNPRNWIKGKKWAHIIMVSLFALVTNMAPTMCVPGTPLIIHDFHIASTTVGVLAITIYVLGLAVGPMILSPLSEVYGRLPVYHASNFLFLMFLIGCGLSQTVAQFMVFRFFAGCMGGVPMPLGGATIADLLDVDGRPVAMAVFSLGPLTGPVVGPLIGGFTIVALGWRWSFWLLIIISSAIFLPSAVFMRETHPKILLDRKTARLRASTGNMELRSKMVTRRLTARHVLISTLIKPCELLIKSPILLVISIYVALIFGTMYLLFTTFTSVFEGQYGFSTAMSGLVYLGTGVALIFSLVSFHLFGGRILQWCMKKDGVTSTKPEYHLVMMILFSPFVGLGLFMYGWTTFYKVHWIVPIIGTVLIGFGAFFVIMPAQLYLVDLFGSELAASALGANNLLRFIFSPFLPLAGPAMYATLGYGWGNTLLGFLALAFVPFPIVFYKYGDRMHGKLAKM